MKYHSSKIFCTKKQFCTILTALLLPCFSQFTNANILSPQPDIIVLPQEEATENTNNPQKPFNGLYHTKNETYYYVSGNRQTGWQEIAGHIYYFSKKNGKAVKGMKEIEKDTYFFSKNGTMCTGWIRNNGGNYYFDNETGKMLTGWQNIDGKNYFLQPDGTKKGSLQMNCIAGTKNTGFFFVDENGIQVNDPEITAAVKYIKKYTKDHWSSADKLKKCYETMKSHYYYQPSQETPAVETFSAFAYDLLTNEKGNCYRYAAGFACIAKALGYETRIHIGNVSGKYGELTPHGWAEVKSDGIWRKCDVTMNLFMYAGKTTKKYECLETYKLLIQTGSVYWK